MTSSEHTLLTINGSWETIVMGESVSRLETLLPAYLQARRWFGGKARIIQSARIEEVIPIPYRPHEQSQSPMAYIVLIQVAYTEGEPQTYALSLGCALESEAAALAEQNPQAIVAHLQREDTGEAGVLYDAMCDKTFALVPLDAIANNRQFEGKHGRVVASSTQAFQQVLGSHDLSTLEPAVMRIEQSNTSVMYGRHFILKLFRKVESGINPDLEIGRFLTERTSFANTPPTAGVLEYISELGRTTPLAILQGFVPNQGDAWEYTLTTLHDYFAQVRATATHTADAPLPTSRHLLDIITETPPEPARATIGSYLEAARLLGQRTAEMHIALASAPDDEDFVPEPFDTSVQRAIYRSLCAMCSGTLQTLQSRIGTLPEAARHDAQVVLKLEDAILDSFRSLLGRRLVSMLIRCHGDYHLGQVLWTGQDFMIIDFEGEPARPLSERRSRRSPIQDVAGMLRSFHYAAYAALFEEMDRTTSTPDDRATLEQWAQCWYLWVASAFLSSYLERTHDTSFAPTRRAELKALLDAYLLDKAIYELGYELNNRPDWVRIPLEGILQIVDKDARTAAIAAVEHEAADQPEEATPQVQDEIAEIAVRDEIVVPVLKPVTTRTTRTTPVTTETRPRARKPDTSETPAEARPAARTTTRTTPVTTETRPRARKPDTSETRPAARTPTTEILPIEIEPAKPLVPKPVRTRPIPPEPTIFEDVTRFLSAEELTRFNEGTHYRLYEKLGAHPMVVDGVPGTYFAVWAPDALSVSVIGDFNDWSPERHQLHKCGTSGIWEAFITGIGKGEHYKYHVRSRYNNYRIDKADPFAFHSEVPPQTASIVWDLEYTWGDQEWMTNRAQYNSLESPISIYEMHIGSWVRVPEEGHRFLSYRELAPRLTEYIKRMGFTHVQFLPLTEHPFYGSWGYQALSYFAPTSRYGTPQDFMYLVDYLHQNGIGVFLDWVPSHFTTDGHGLSYFDGSHVYEHASWMQGWHPDWNSFIFNYGRNEVSEFLINSALYWLNVYHIDGLRVDAVASMLYLDYSRKHGEWIPNKYGGRENLEAIDFLQRLNQQIYLEQPDVQTIAEESTSWPMVSRPTYVGGLGFGMKWDMGWMHDTLSYMGRDAVFRKYHHNQLTFRMMYAYNESFVLPLSHDEVVHGKGSLLGRMPGDNWRKFANLRLLFGYMYGLPSKKLLFMGGEFGQWREWAHEASLDWHHTQEIAHSGLQQWVSDLNHFYREEPALYELDCDPAGFEWVDCTDWERSVIIWLRKGKTTRHVVVFAANFTPVPRSSYRVGVPYPGFWQEVLNSDSTIYWGSGTGNSGGLQADEWTIHGRPYSISIALPPLAVVVFKNTWLPELPADADEEDGASADTQ